MVDDNITSGHYYRKQIGSSSWLISWSHASRFQIGLQLAKPYAGLKLLDYGCGDGTFLAMLSKTPFRPDLSVGADLDDGQVNDCNKRFARNTSLKFVRIDQLRDVITSENQFDAVFCMEVLEHVVDLDPLFQDWKLMAKPGAAIIVSVPVETGIALAVKQAARIFAGWRGIGDYPGNSPYTWAEFFKSLFAGNRQHMNRPVHGLDRGTPAHCHKGFNWRWLRAELQKHFQIEKTVSSPLSWLPVGLGSQVWIVMKNKGISSR